MDSQAPFYHHRICNASYAVLTSDADVFRSACEAADTLAQCGFHLGVVWLNADYPPLRLLPVANLLHPLQACAVVDTRRAGQVASLATRVLELARNDGTSPWRGRMPRLLTLEAEHSLAMAAMDLVTLARGLADHSIADGDPVPAGGTLAFEQDTAPALPRPAAGGGRRARRAAVVAAAAAAAAVIL